MTAEQSTDDPMGSGEPSPPTLKVEARARIAGVMGYRPSIIPTEVDLEADGDSTAEQTTLDLPPGALGEMGETITELFDEVDRLRAEIERLRAEMDRLTMHPEVSPSAGDREMAERIMDAHERVGDSRATATVIAAALAASRATGHAAATKRFEAELREAAEAKAIWRTVVADIRTQADGHPLFNKLADMIERVIGDKPKLAS